MNYEDLSFFNQQLAAMLRTGIPLEGALKRLSADMKRGVLKSELVLLELELAKGTSFANAIRARQFPELYQQMLEVGVRSNDLPAMLTMLADHYQHRHILWTRLKGLMVYPTIVLVAAFLLSCSLAVILNSVLLPSLSSLAETFETQAMVTVIGIWIPPVFLGLAVLIVVAGFCAPPLRGAFRWRLPALKESNLAQMASAMSLMLKSGLPLSDALALMERLEQGTAAGAELSQWRQRLASGRGKFNEIASGGKIFPPLFVWMVGNAGEDLEAGFQRAAEIYQARASYRAELLLYSALPCSVLALGLMIVAQMKPVLASFALFIRSLGSEM